jgi:hypothetical protein
LVADRGFFVRQRTVSKRTRAAYRVDLAACAVREPVNARVSEIVVDGVRHGRDSASRVLPMGTSTD